MPTRDDNGLERLLSRLSDGAIRRHFLAPIAYQLGNTRFLKDFAASTLIAEYREEALGEAVSALSSHQIPVVLLKGASYATSLYADPGDRPMSDVDLMVPRERRSDACRALRGLGYWDAGENVSSARNYHAITFKRRNGSIDLHWTIVQPWRSRIDVDGLWDRALPASERIDGALRLEPVDEAVVHLAHIARSELRVPLINYEDARRLMVRADRRAVLARAAQFRLARGARAALAMTGALLDGTPFSGALLPTPEDIVSGHLPARPRQIAHKLALLEGPRELLGLGAAYLRNLLGR